MVTAEVPPARVTTIRVTPASNLGSSVHAGSKWTGVGVLSASANVRDPWVQVELPFTIQVPAGSAESGWMVFGVSAVNRKDQVRSWVAELPFAYVNVVVKLLSVCVMVLESRTAIRVPLIRIDRTRPVAVRTMTHP